MRLTREQETQATEKMIEMLDGAYRCRRNCGLKTVEMHAALNGELSLSQISRLLRKSGKACATLSPQYDNLWRLTPDELRKRFTYSGDAA
jgi:hypothetical protein